MLANQLSDFVEKGGRIAHAGTDDLFELVQVFGSWVVEAPILWLA